MSRRLKGQLFSGDFMLSIAIFLIVISVILISFNRISGQSRQEDLAADLESSSLFATDVLMKTDGFPTNWTNTTVIVPGFLENGTISRRKVSNFTQLDHNKAKYMLGLSYFDFNMSVTYLNGSRVFNESGGSATSFERLSVTDRVGVMDGQIVKIRFLFWK